MQIPGSKIASGYLHVRRKARISFLGVIQMTCAWNELLAILPLWLRTHIEPYQESFLLEIRLRINKPPELVTLRKNIWLSHIVQAEDISFCINTASRYSPWSAATSAQGFITAPGGHRIGLCGDAVVKDHQLSGIRSPQSICIRVARDVSGIANNAVRASGSILILGAPGWGKTTLLRDLSRSLAQEQTVCVVDERQELFPVGYQRGRRMDVLSGCPKASGIEVLLRTMGPDIIAVDEISSQNDCNAILNAFGCGVRLIATAHAAGRTDYMQNRIYAPIRERNVFQTFLVLHPDKSFHTEVGECLSNGSVPC